MPKKKVPIILQMEVVECGSACLGMVLAHFGRWESMERLRTACGVSRDGVSAGNIARAAQQFGLRVRALSTGVSGLAALPFPQILFWNFNHFVVLERITKKGFHIVDPAMGRRVLSNSEFDAGFTGVTICTTPSDQFEKKGHPPSLTNEFFERMSASRKDLMLIILVGILAAIPGIIIPSFSRVFVDFYLVERYESWLDWLLWIMLGTAIMVSLITALQQTLILKLSTKVSIAGAGETLWRLLRLPINYFMQRTTGEIGGRIMLTDEVAGTITGPILNIIIGAIQILIYLAVMLTYSASLTAITCGLSLVNVWIQYRVALRLQGASQRLELEQGKYDANSLQSLTLIDFFKASGLEHLLFSRNIGAHSRLLNAEQTLGRSQRSVGVLPGFLSSLLMLAVLFFGALEVMDGRITIGMYVAYQALARLFNMPLTQIVSSFASINAVSGTFMRINDVYRSAESWEFRQLEGEVELKATSDISVRGLTYAFSQNNPPVLRDLNVDIKAGSVVALVGMSGSGKSTLGRLITGLFEPPRGTIFVDGHDLHDIPRETLRDRVHLVEQDNLMFKGTVTENLTVWDNTLPDSALVEACQAAGIHQDITMRKGAYQSQVADRGGDVSGGQQQRFAIARGLIRTPSVLILDESTSALDADTEHRVLENLRSLGITVILVSHRLSAIRDCDDIIVLDGGCIVDQGTHGELLKKSVIYQQMMATLND
ncbi:MAG: NHLP family bacteriocin export ABC transporter peptidase/permease/ATPase [Gemmatimonadetes bacterium]|nr:NHLP family bacteriocin export ABC transporter peptidase/permease/ATPase [Gemmatimonadota bacterium]